MISFYYNKLWCLKLTLTAPASRTSILSESITVCSRWATVKTVHSRNFVRMVFWIKASVLQKTSKNVQNVRKIKLLKYSKIYVKTLSPKVSYSGSTFAVASSSTNILFLRSIARPRQTSCRCPTLKFDPFSVTYGLGQ